MGNPKIKYNKEYWKAKAFEYAGQRNALKFRNEQLELKIAEFRKEEKS